MSQSIIPLLVMLLPMIGLMSGFFAAIAVPLLLLTILINLRDKIFICLNYHTIQKILLSKWKLELLFGFWCLVTAVYSINYPSSLFYYIEVCLVVTIGFIVADNIDKLSINVTKTKKYFIIGSLIAMVLFFIEYTSHGIITRTFRSIFQPKSNQQFFLFLLDHGCCLLSILSWVVIAIIISYHKYLLTLIYYLLIFYLLYISDSLASFLGFTIGGLVFLSNMLLVRRAWQSMFLKLFTIAMISGSILMPIVADTIQPRYAVDHYAKFLPDSAKHRVFIWHFVAEQIAKKPILGYGFAASRNFEIKEQDFVKYNQWVWSPLPLHPHNNIMQILLETGLIGFLLFLLLLYKYIKKIGNLCLVPSIKYDRVDLTNKNNMVTYQSAAYGCFINYYIIGMIAFNIWQIWWVCSAFAVIILFKLFFLEALVEDKYHVSNI